MEKISIKGWSREKWLTERRKSLGGSDIGAVLGLNSYETPYSVWADKRGYTADEEDSESMRLGRDLEQYVASRFEEVSGKRVRRVNAILRNPEFPHIHANIDREIVGERAGLECKTASALSASKFNGVEFPKSYYAQCVTYLAVTGYTRWYLAALILGKDFKVYQMTRIPDDEVPEWCAGSVYVDDDEIRVLAQVAKDFWETYVETGNPPPADGEKSTSDAMNRVLGDSNPEKEEIDLVAISEAVEEYARLKEEKDALEKQLSEAANQIKQFMKDAPRGGLEIGGTVYTVNYSTQTRNLFDADKFKRDHPEIDLTAYSKESKSRPFKVSVKEKE